MTDSNQMRELPASISNLAKVIGEVDLLIEEQVIADYAIGGAVAAVLHNEPISTNDLDIFFLLREPPGLILSLEKIYDFARRRGFVVETEFIIIHGWPVQFVEASNTPLWMDAIGTAIERIVDNRSLRLIDAEHLVIMWAMAARAKDQVKIAAFDEAGLIDFAKLRKLLETFNLMDAWQRIQHNLSNELRF